jgi:nicotinate-nucleotide pyrophosphorylase (carboxylating)
MRHPGFDHDETLEEARRATSATRCAKTSAGSDWTGLLVPAGSTVRGPRDLPRARGAVRPRLVRRRGARARPRGPLDWQVAEGGWMAPDPRGAHLHGDARALLAAERPALNFLQLLSATATETRRHVDAIAGASPNPRGCAVLDTRKTLPGLRLAQKYAVRVGGGQNQRLALWTAS